MSRSGAKFRIADALDDDLVDPETGNTKSRQRGTAYGRRLVVRRDGPLDRLHRQSGELAIPRRAGGVAGERSARDVGSRRGEQRRPREDRRGSCQPAKAHRYRRRRSAPAPISEAPSRASIGNGVAVSGAGAPSRNS
jgi:hypothetical protein